MKTTKLKKSALSVVIKGPQGNDPSASNPVHIRMSQTIRPVTAAMSAFKNAGTNWRTKKMKKQKRDAYGSDSPMVADISRVRSLALHWITQDATDHEYPYKLTDEDFGHLIRDMIGIAPRLLSIHIPPQTVKKKIDQHYRRIAREVRYSAATPLQIYFQPMKPAKKAGAKVKKVNKLKGAKTAKAKKALKTKKK